MIQFVFADLLYCADCHKKLWHHVNTRNKDIHYFSRFGGMISEDRLSFVVLADRAYTFELIESAKDRLVFQYKDNGAKAVLKKED